jgi:hypothetical protein
MRGPAVCRREPRCDATPARSGLFWLRRPEPSSCEVPSIRLTGRDAAGSPPR